MPTRRFKENIPIFVYPRAFLSRASDYFCKISGSFSNLSFSPQVVILGTCLYSSLLKKTELEFVNFLH